jgi:two-component system, NtrC family, response regulator AtoC
MDCIMGVALLRRFVVEFDHMTPRLLFHERASMRLLQQCRWPGNIRQLQNVIEQRAVLSDGGELEVPATALGESGNDATDWRGDMDGACAGHPTLEENKKRYISHLLTSTHGNMLRAAAILDVDRRSLYRMVARYELGTSARHQG